MTYICKNCKHETTIKDKSKDKRCSFCMAKLSDEDKTNDKKVNRSDRLVNSGRGKAC